MKLTYQTPDAVTIGKQYPDSAFVLQNSWNLEEVDLDQKLRDNKTATQQPSSQMPNGATHFQHQ